MALVIPPPTTIPNALNPTTAAVERDAEKREITPAITPDNASASTADSTAEKDFVNYAGNKHNSGGNKKHSSNPEPQAGDDDENGVLAGEGKIAETSVNELDNLILTVDMTEPAEVIIANILLLRQAILAKKNLSANDRQQLAEINYIIKTALADLLRLKQLDEIKLLAAQQPRSTEILSGEVAHVDVIALSELFTASAEHADSESTISAKSKLAGAVVGYFYGENIEPQPPAQIDHQE